MALINYNRSILTNLRNGVSIPVTSTPRRIMEFGLFIDNPVNFVELLTTVGWDVTNVESRSNQPNQPTLQIEVRMDGTTVGSTTQESISNNEDEPLEMTTKFQTVLTNVSAGHHVFQVFVSNTQPEQGDITISGPANVSGKLIRNS